MARAAASGDPAPNASVTVADDDPEHYGAFRGTTQIAPGVTASYLAYSASGSTNQAGRATVTLYGQPTGPIRIITYAPGQPSTTTNTTLTGQTGDLTLFLVGQGFLLGGAAEDLRDGDNVSPVIETQVPSINPLTGQPTGTTGDGNGDGTPDAQQENVTSLPILGSTNPGADDFVTVAAPADTKLENVSTKDPTTLAATNELPAESTLPEGLAAFKVDLPDDKVGEDVVVTIYTGSTTGVVGYAKFTPDAAGGSGTWSLLPNDRVTIYPNRIEIRLTDGGIGDADGAANGIIDDPGGPIIIPDTTPPTVTIDGIEEGGTYAKGEVTPTCTATDDMAGVDGDCTISASGGDANGLGTVTYTARAVDFARNTGSAEVTVTISDSDTAPPVVRGTVAPGPNGNGWHRDDVTVSWTATYPLPSSGGVSAPSPTVVTGEGEALTATSAPACDAAGNCATGEVTGIRIDRTAPKLTLRPTTQGSGAAPLLPTYLLGAEPEFTCEASDALAGLDGPCLVSDPTAADPSPTGVGSFTVTATAADRAGNVATATFTYRITYRVDGFRQPINDPRLVPDAQRSVFKAGSTVPVKFQVKDADGSIVTPASAPLWITPIKGTALSEAANEAATTEMATTGSAFKQTEDGWQFNWKTPKTAAGSWYTIGARLDDGSVVTVVIGLR